jgi:hypothetical protein
MTPPDLGHELRRRSRIAASLLVQIKGEDDDPVLRHGNLSTTGAYLEFQRNVGPAGSVQLLTLGTRFRNLWITVMARIVRTLTLEDIERGKLYGVAFDFMPDSAKLFNSLEDFCRAVLEEQLQAHGEVATSQRAIVRTHSNEQPVSARIGSMGLSRVVIETDWVADVGDAIEVSVRAPNRVSSVPFLGKVARVEAIGPREFRLEVGSLAPVRTEVFDTPWSDDTISSALAFAIGETVDEIPRHHLAGSLDRIGMAPMLALLEMERISGKLSVQRGDSTLVLVISEGRILDVEGAGESSVVALVHSAVSSRAGTFEFHVDDSVKSIAAPAHGITGVLLEAARRQDEEAR